MAFGLFKKSEKKSESKPEGGASSKYHDLQVKEIVKETKDAISIVFAQPTDHTISYRSGQFLTLIIPIQGKEVRRAYSLCTSPFVDTDLAVTVKRVDGGLMSNYLADNLKAGDRVKVMEPMGQFTTEFSASNKRHIIMFAGGSGITPMMSLIKSIINQEPESIVSLIYCNRDIDSIIFKDELEKLQTKYEGRLHVIHVLDNAPMNWQGYSGLLNHDMLSKLVERIPDWGIEKTTYLMCGPEGMMKNVDTLLAARSIPKEKIFKESFVQGTIDKAEKKEEPASDGEVKAREVTIRYDGEEYKIMVEPGKAILETALDQGIDLPYSCQSGLCTACRGKALSGKVKLDEEEGLSQSERDEGYVLTCVGHPMTDDVVIEIG
ncbi:MAG TPA: ferredoxin--NADP reductase [Cyclobacteriaceae bacterium]|nr:ferredoxin--NADP reductase [Cyclobacteriaceae bacterium]